MICHDMILLIYYPCIIHILLILSFLIRSLMYWSCKNNKGSGDFCLELYLSKQVLFHFGITISGKLTGAKRRKLSGMIHFITGNSHPLPHSYPLPTFSTSSGKRSSNCCGKDRESWAIRAIRAIVTAASARHLRHLGHPFSKHCLRRYLTLQIIVNYTPNTS